MQSKSKTVMSVIPAQVRVIASSSLVFVTIVAASGHRPYLFLTLFFVYQVAMKFLTKTHLTEWIFVAPAKVATALVMVMSGIPDNSAGLFWIGLSMLFLSSGFRDFQRIRRVWQGSTPLSTPAVESVGTARQRGKAAKAEEHLFDDLAEFLSDSKDEGK